MVLKKNDTNLDLLKMVSGDEAHSFPRIKASAAKFTQIQVQNSFLKYSFYIPSFQAMNDALFMTPNQGLDRKSHHFQGSGVIN